VIAARPDDEDGVLSRALFKIEKKPVIYSRYTTNYIIPLNVPTHTRGNMCTVLLLYPHYFRVYQKVIRGAIFSCHIITTAKIRHICIYFFKY
jgi:hypothetical protein